MKELIVLLGPTGVGKTELSLQLAEALGSPIISADSRQLFREIPIGTAAPTAEETARVPHYFVGTHSVSDTYNAGMYERDVLQLLDELFKTHDRVLMVGGSMMYIDAVCTGFDDIPSADETLRSQLANDYREKGLAWLQAEVERLDPAYWAEVDQQNPQRLLHALEVTIAAGRPYSTFRTGQKKKRAFGIRKIGLTRPREELYERINRRVDVMLAQGLVEEAKCVQHLREQTALNTVGYKELWPYLDGQCSLDEAADMIRQDSRHYAKRQLTWFRRDPEIQWIDLSQTCDIQDILKLVDL